MNEPLKIEHYYPETHDAETALLRAREIYIDGLLDEERVPEWVHQLKYLELAGDDPITVVISSPGGLVMQAFALHDAIRRLSVPVVTVGMGEVASGAGIILQAGTAGRVVTPNTWMMIREAQSNWIGNTTEFKDHTVLLERLEKQLFGILSEKSTLTDAEIKHNCTRKDWWLDAQEIVGYGFADAITEGISGISNLTITKTIGRDD